MSENNTIKLPEVVVFAGPNGSGKTTITRMAKFLSWWIYVTYCIFTIIPGSHLEYSKKEKMFFIDGVIST